MQGFPPGVVRGRPQAGRPGDFPLRRGELAAPEVLVGRQESLGALDRREGRRRGTGERAGSRAHEGRFRLPGEAVPIVHGQHFAVLPAEVLGFEVGVAQHARQVGGQQPLAGPAGGVDDVRGHGALVPLVEEPDRGPQPGTPVVPAHPARVGQRRRDGHVGQLGHQPGEHRGTAHGDVRRVTAQHFAARQGLFGVHGQRVDDGHGGDRPGAREPPVRQPGLRGDARAGPAVVLPRFHHDLAPVGQPQPDHRRKGRPLEQHLDRLGSELLDAPGCQPVHATILRRAAPQDRQSGLKTPRGAVQNGPPTYSAAAPVGAGFDASCSAYTSASSNDLYPSASASDRE